MTYQVLARKWRPRNFQELIGQGHVVQALTNALKQGRLHHAYLFTGTRGVGKTTVARVFAKALSCEQGVSAMPCGVCAACVAIDEGRYVDLIEVDAASRTTVNETRDLLDNVQYAPSAGRFKLYLIDEVHMFSGHSFNALLKTLEEPPAHVKFLLATTDPKKLPVTILSRCLQFNLKRVQVEAIATHIGKLLEAEGISNDVESRRLLADAADGSVRDALSLTDQAIAYGGGALRDKEVRAWIGTVDKGQVVRLLHCLASADTKGLFAEIERISAYDPDYGAVLNELLALLHTVAVKQVLGKADGEEATDQSVNTLCTSLSPEDCQLFYQIGLHGRRDLPLTADPRRGFEMVMLRMLAFGRLQADTGDLTKGPETGAESDNRGIVYKPEQASLHPARPSPGDRREAMSANVTESPAPLAQEAMPKPCNAAPAETVPDWGNMITTMKLSGMLREFALNCVLTECTSQRVVLTLAPEFGHMRSERIEQRLEAQLKTLLGAHAKLKVTTADLGTAVTPAAQLARQDEAALAAARASLESDANIRQIKDVFAAEMQMDSVRPVG